MDVVHGRQVYRQTGDGLAAINSYKRYWRWRNDKIHDKDCRGVVDVPDKDFLEPKLQGDEDCTQNTCVVSNRAVHVRQKASMDFKKATYAVWMTINGLLELVHKTLDSWCDFQQRITSSKESAVKVDVDYNSLQIGRIQANAKLVTTTYLLMQTTYIQQELEDYIVQLPVL